MTCAARLANATLKTDIVDDAGKVVAAFVVGKPVDVVNAVSERIVTVVLFAFRKSSHEE